VHTAAAAAGAARVPVGSSEPVHARWNEERGETVHRYRRSGARLAVRVRVRLVASAPGAAPRRPAPPSGSDAVPVRRRRRSIEDGLRGAVGDRKAQPLT